MPTSLFAYPILRRKSIKLLVLLLLSPLFFYGQSLTGLWVGSISNDSTTVRKDQSFEIALTEYRGKVYGYSRSEFIVDNVLYYVVKRVKGTIDGDICEVVDDEIIAFNFPTKLDKGVKVTSTFKRNKEENVWQLEGTWKTNATKKYYAVTGKVGLEEEKDLTASKIFPHLEELKLANEIVFYKERQEGIPIVKIAKPEKIRSEYTTTDSDLTPASPIVAIVSKPALSNTVTSGPSLINNSIQSNEEAVEEPHSVKRTVNDLPKSKTQNIPDNNINVQPAKAETKVALNKTPVEPERNIVANLNTEKKETQTTVEKQIIAQTTAPKNNTEQAKQVNNVAAKKDADIAANKTTTTKTESKTVIKSDPVSEKKAIDQTVKPVAQHPKQVNTVVEKTVAKKETEKTATNETTPTLSANKTSPVTASTIAVKKESVKEIQAIATIKKPIEEITKSAAVIDGRKSTFTQEVNYKSDSLVLSLYDNGEIDGDTVSVYLNGEILMAKQGLKASAIKKTIYISPDSEDFSLVLFADNLGKYPPNTGLLVVRDGDDVYNLRFSSDFQKNAGIVFRRKK